VAVVIRMQRVGARNRPYWHLVAADSRKPRDGRFLEKLGFYDPVPNPAVLKIDLEKIEGWIRKGAKPSVKVQSLIRSARRGGPVATEKKAKAPAPPQAPAPSPASAPSGASEAPAQPGVVAVATEPEPEASAGPEPDGTEATRDEGN